MSNSNAQKTVINEQDKRKVKQRRSSKRYVVYKYSYDEQGNAYKSYVGEYNYTKDRDEALVYNTYLQAMSVVEITSGYCEFHVEKVFDVH